MRTRRVAHMWPNCRTQPVHDHLDYRQQPFYLGLLIGAGEGNRTLMTSLEGWGSAIELRPRGRCGLAAGSLRVSYRASPQERCKAVPAHPGRPGEEPTAKRMSGRVSE